MNAMLLTSTKMFTTLLEAHWMLNKSELTRHKFMCSIVTKFLTHSVNSNMSGHIFTKNVITNRVRTLDYAAQTY